jgi:hypothetical protein
MATLGEDWSKTATEAAQTAQDVVRRYMDDSTAFGRAYWRAWSSSAQAGLGVAFVQQNAMLQVARTMVEANAQASRDWLGQVTEMMNVSHDATSKWVNASMDLMDSTVNGVRA